MGDINGGPGRRREVPPPITLTSLGGDLTRVTAWEGNMKLSGQSLGSVGGNSIWEENVLPNKKEAKFQSGSKLKVSMRGTSGSFPRTGRRSTASPPTGTAPWEGRRKWTRSRNSPHRTVGRNWRRGGGRRWEPVKVSHTHVYCIHTGSYFLARTPRFIYRN